jgi:hypothetical protein
MERLDGTLHKNTVLFKQETSPIFEVSYKQYEFFILPHRQTPNLENKLDVTQIPPDN